MTDQIERLREALADRYALERELGAGGMATVYLARDLRHERQVAIKVLRPELAAALGPDRFLQEIKIAANLNHPHIMPLYDSGRAAEVQGGSGREVLYYVMPYVKGESLREKLTREGELPIAEAVRILKEIVDALAKAHSENVVHRDIKPDNVMLSDRHALVTDFGVAKAVSEATGRQGLTTAGVALGTPAYMAPEQAAADPHIDHRADIYAVGAVAYELLTGRPPFTGNTQQEILAAHVTQVAEPVTKYRDSVPPALEQLVLKCLEKKPADRWQTAGELLPQLEALATPSGGTTPVGTESHSPVPRVKRMVIGVAAVAAVAVGILAGTFLRGTGRSVVDERRIVVAPFANLTGEDSLDLLGHVTASWITGKLQHVEVFSVVPWMAVQQEATSAEGGASTRELAEMTGAGIVVSGSYSIQQDSLRFQAEITDRTGLEVLNTVPPVSGSRANRESALETLSERIAGALAIQLDTILDAAGIEGLTRPTYAAYVDQVRGYDLMSRGRASEAVEFFTAAYDRDTTFVAVLLMAAVAELNRNGYAAADSLVEMVARSRDRLTRFEGQFLRWNQEYLRGRLREALDVTREIVAENPNWGNWQYELGLDANSVNRPIEAIEALESIDPTRGWMKEWRPYWSVLTRARHMVGDYGQELEDVMRGRAQHPDSRGLVEQEVRALAAMGRVEEVREVLAQHLSSPPHPTRGHSYPAVIAGLELRAHGYADAADAMFELAFERLDAHTPEEGRRDEHQYFLGRVLHWSGQWDEAFELFNRYADRYSENLHLNGYLGVLHARLGNEAEAARISGEIAALDRPYLWGSNTLWRARIAAVLGDERTAVDLLRQAFNEGLSYGIGLHRDVDLESLRGYEPFDELMRPKG